MTYRADPTPSDGPLRQRAWASCSRTKTPSPSHHGHGTVEGEPPRLEITWPVPRQTEHRGGGAAVSASSAIAPPRLPSAGVRPDGRFAPSPTGTLHLGNLRTALLAWLFARSQRARFLVRVEDLDTGRVRREHEAEQLNDLADLGLDWDGEVVRQSERLSFYDAALARLDGHGLLYECWCTRREIREAA